MTQPRDAHGRFAKRRRPGEAWASQVRAAERAAKRDGENLHALLFQQQRDRDLRTGLRKRRRCEDVLRNHAPGRDGERINFHDWKVQQADEPSTPPWETKPEDKPYDWWRRLPICEDDALNAALHQAVQRAHPHWKRMYRSKLFRLALLGGGSFRDCFHVLTEDGYDTGLIVKRPTRGRRDHVRHGLCDLAYDQGNGQEATVYLHLAETAPEALACFPVLYETEPVYGDWAIHEKVRPECYGKENLLDLERRWSSAGIYSGDLHNGNIGRRDSDRCTLVIDWGHFTVRGLHYASHRARR